MKGRRILLVNAPHTDAGEEIRRFSRPWPALDLLNCAALLRSRGHDAGLLDYRAESFTDGTLRAAIRWADRIVVTTTPLDRWQCPTLNTGALFRFIRRFPSEKTFVAGTHGTMKPEWVLRETGAAGIIVGEPESAMESLAAEGDPAGRPGLAVLRDGGLIRNRAAPLDLTSFPVPAFDLLRLEKYRYELLGERFLLLEAARGCPYACTFCSREMYGKPVRRKHVDQVIEEIRRARVETNFLCAYFIDLEFTFHRAPVIELCEKLLALPFHFDWACQTRLDQVDEDLLLLMRRAGCRLIHLGVESGSEKHNKLLKKGIALDKIRAQHALVKRCGFETALFFLIGHPGETPDEQRETIQFACDLDPDYASFHIASPYPGTTFHETSEHFAEPFPAFDSHHHKLADLDQMRRHALRKFYLRPRYIARSLQPHRFRHALHGGAELFWRLLS